MSNVPNNQLNFPQPPVAGTAHADAIPRINNDLSSLLQFFYDGRLDRDWTIWHMQEYFTAAVQNINWIGDNEAILTPWYQAIDDHERQTADAATRAREAEEARRQRPSPVPTPRRRPRSPAGDESDNEREQPQKKKTKPDTGKYAWTAEAFIAHSLMSDKHLDIIAAIENYALDHSGALASLLNSGVNPSFPKHLWSPILRDEAVEFNDIHAHTYSGHIDSSTTYPSNTTAAAILTSFGTKPASKKVTDKSTWIDCWGVYSKAVCTVFEGREKELQKYETFVRGLFQSRVSTEHHNVINFDRAARKIIGERRDILFSDIAHDSISECREAHLNPGGVRYVVAGGETKGKAATILLAEGSTSAPSAAVPTHSSPTSAAPVVEPSASGSYLSRFWRSASNARREEEVENVAPGSWLPRYLRGFGWRDGAKPLYSRTAWYTEVDDPLPRPP
ncbi:hypothetical protein BDZ89DRAFT_1061832, partial [Hymenopellis radicata]